MSQVWNRRPCFFHRQRLSLLAEDFVSLEYTIGLAHCTFVHLFQIDSDTNISHNDVVLGTYSGYLEVVAESGFIMRTRVKKRLTFLLRQALESFFLLSEIIYLACLVAVHLCNVSFFMWVDVVMDLISDFC